MSNVAGQYPYSYSPTFRSAPSPSVPILNPSTSSTPYNPSSYPNTPPQDFGATPYNPAFASHVGAYPHMDGGVYPGMNQGNLLFGNPPPFSAHLHDQDGRPPEKFVYSGGRGDVGA